MFDIPVSLVTQFGISRFEVGIHCDRDEFGVCPQVLPPADAPDKRRFVLRQFRDLVGVRLVVLQNFARISGLSCEYESSTESNSARESLEKPSRLPGMRTATCVEPKHDASLVVHQARR